MSPSDCNKSVDSIFNTNHIDTASAITKITNRTCVAIMWTMWPGDLKPEQMQKIHKCSCQIQSVPGTVTVTLTGTLKPDQLSKNSQVFMSDAICGWYGHCYGHVWEFQVSGTLKPDQMSKNSQVFMSDSVCGWYGHCYGQWSDKGLS